MLPGGPWDDLDFSVADLLPLSEAEARQGPACANPSKLRRSAKPFEVQALEILESKVPNWRKAGRRSGRRTCYSTAFPVEGFLTPDDERGVRRRFRKPGRKEALRGCINLGRLASGSWLGQLAASSKAE